MSQKSDFEKLKENYEKLVANYEKLKFRMKSDLTVRVNNLLCNLHVICIMFVTFLNIVMWSFRFISSKLRFILFNCPIFQQSWSILQ